MARQSYRQSVEMSDLFRLQFIQDARLSPDGSRVVYVVSQVDAEEEKEYRALWLLALATGEVRRLVAGESCDLQPAWSPDGRQIAFLSDRDGKPQIHLIPADGGEAQRLTSLKQGVGGGPVWSPDGTQIAFTAGPEEKPLDREAPYRLTRPLYRYDAIGYLANEVQDIYVIPAEGGEPQRLTNDGYHNTELRWSPDGQELLYRAAMFPDSFRSRPTMRVVNLAGAVRDLSSEWGYAFSAAWLPDGEQIVFTGIPRGRPAGSGADLWIVDRQGG
ncbi:MAG: S9 family peptidase, partial [Chloroflexota bacterium]|nr:S9 family peptidase [Chloroflexota bacterium]